MPERDRDPHAHVLPWKGRATATDDAMRTRLAEEGLSGYVWSAGPHAVFAVHSHPFDKVIYVLRGSIIFALPASGCQLDLARGDRLDLPEGTEHAARAGGEGVTCLEAHRATHG